MQEMQSQSQGRKDPLGKVMTAHSSVWPGKSMDRGAWLTTVRWGHKSQAQISD